MSRLSEALERAATPASVANVAPDGIAATRSTGPDVPPAWQFDNYEAETPPSRSRASTADVALEDRAPSYRFDAARLGKLVVGDRCERGVVEQYRRLAAVFHQAQVERGTRSVMIASAVAGEGKTLTATNLALTFSHSYQRRVLLIDADLRRPGLHTVFGVSNQVGLRDCLTELQAERLPVQQLSPTLWVLPAGRPDPDPMSGLVSDTMKQLLSDAAAQFDWVIVDTPPVGLMPDANLLAGMIDSALLVVSATTTPYPLARRAIEAIGSSRVLGVVLNRAQKQVLGDQYENYGYYGH